MTTSTSRSVSADSGEYWTVGDAWEVDPGVFRIPLPLPMDGLKAVNVYAIRGEDGLTLIDGGWAITEGREQLDRALKGLGHDFSEITRFLVTHMHRDHYTLAAVLGKEYGAEVLLGADEQPALEYCLAPEPAAESPFVRHLRRCGSTELAAAWAADDAEPSVWHPPTGWLQGEERFSVGGRELAAVHTPGHTPGHFVFADLAGGVLFAGDHVLPTITPSIGFAIPVPETPLGDFLGSLAKMRALPDLRLLPAHGPVAPSTHTVVDELLLHHERRLTHAFDQLSASPVTARDVAGQLPWTRHARKYSELGPFDAGLAVMETHAHLELLVAQGRARRVTTDGVDGYALP